MDWLTFIYINFLLIHNLAKFSCRRICFVLLRGTNVKEEQSWMQNWIGKGKDDTRRNKLRDIYLEEKNGPLRIHYILLHNCLFYCFRSIFKLHLNCSFLFTSEKRRKICRELRKNSSFFVVRTKSCGNCCVVSSGREMTA